MNRNEKQHRVLTVGPSLKCLGGISSVLASYSRSIPGFRHLPTNSRFGTIAGAFVLAATMLRMPFFHLAGYDIVHAQGASGKSFRRKMIVLAWARLLGFRTIFHSHAGRFKVFAESAGKEKIASQLHKCDAIITLGQLWYDYFTKELGCRNVFVVNNIVEPPLAPVMRQESPREPMRLLFIGKICADKGVYDILDALEMRREEFEGQVEVIFAGEGESDRLASEIAAKGLESMTRLIGSVTGDKKDRALRDSDILILPSYVEGLPITLLEAGVYHMPSIATNVGCIPDFLKNGVNGVLIEPGKPEQIADAIAAYLRMPGEVAAQGEKAAGCIGPYLPESVDESLNKVYNSII